ncbi:MAG: hypothetical protein JNK73_13260 [Bacteroidia bacterium]|nr:hypothetical protein [Bacteroidia bacterium]
MKKIDVKLGGHHFTGDDLLFVQESLTEAVKVFAEMFGNSFFAIYGVEVSIAGPTISWTAGWLYINGEICKVDAGSATLASNDTFVIQETYDSAGNQAYEDLNVEDTYVIRKATISGTAGGPNHYTNLKSISLGVVGGWQPLTYSGDWVNSSVIPAFRKNQIQEVVFKGSIQITNYDATPDAVAFTIPAGYRPKAYTIVGLPALVNSIEYKTLVVLINDVNGVVAPLGIQPGDDVTIFLADLRFPTN